MRDYRHGHHGFGVAMAACVCLLLISCQTREPSDQSKEMSMDVRLVSQIGRVNSRYRAALDLAGYAQTAVERSLAERHCEINRDILKLEFARVKLQIEDIAALRGKNNEKQAGQAGAIVQQDDVTAADADKVNADIERAQKLVSSAERNRRKAKNAKEIEQAEAALTRARQALEIAYSEGDLFENKMKIADLRRKESIEAHDGIKSLQNKMALLEKELLGNETTDIKWGDSVTPSSGGLIGAFRSWWNLYDKGQVLDRAQQRAARTSDSLKASQSENQKLLQRLRDEQRALNQQIQSRYDEANQLLVQPGQDEKAGRLLEEAGAQMKTSLTYSARREKINQMRDVLNQQSVLATEDVDRLTSWIQRVSDNRARALTRLLNRLGSLVGMIFAVFVVAYFIKKIPRRFVKEEKSAYYFRKLIGFVAWLVVIIMVILDSAGGIGSITAVVGLAGAGLAIALQDPIVSLVGWFLVVGKYGISVGDRVEINNVKGDVVDVGMLRIAVMEVGNWLSGEQSTGRMVFFPNSFIFKGHFFNYSTANSFIWDEIHILVTYESQWRKAREIILKVAEEVLRDVVERARESQEKLARRFHISLGSPEPYTFITIADSGVDVVLRYLSEIKLRRVTRDRICREILEVFEKEKDIELAYPTQRQLTETRIINVTDVPGKEVSGNIAAK